MKILTKLLAGFLAVALLCAVVGGVALSQVTVLSGSIRELAENSIPSLAYLNAIKFEMTNIKTAIRSIAHPYDEFINVLKTLHMIGLDNKEKIDVKGVLV